MLPALLLISLVVDAGPVPHKKPAEPAAPEAPVERRPDAELRKEAGAHYKRGVDFFKEGNYPAALTEFKSAYEAVPSFEVRFNIALCERRLFNYAGAMRTLTLYLMEGGEKIPADRREAVAREVQSIKALTSPVAVIVDGPPATVLVDGEAMGQTPLSELLLLGVGRHKLRAERAGCSPDEKTIEVRSGQAQSVELAPASLTEPVEIAVECATPGSTVSADEGTPVDCPATLSLPPGSHELTSRAPGFIAARSEVVVEPGKSRKVKLTELAPRPRPFPTLGVSLLGGGVVLGGVGLAFALAASSNAQQTTDLVRAGGPWTASAIATQASGQRSSVLAWVFLGTGAAALTAGVVTLVLQLGSHAPLEVALLPTPGGLLACATF